MMSALRFFCLLLMLGLTWPACAQRIVRNGIPKGRIVLAESGDATAMQAARLLQRFIRESSGAELPVLSVAKPRSGDVMIGRLSAVGLSDNLPTLTTDGYCLRNSDGVLRIGSGGGKGAVYGVVTLLERYLGMNYYAANAYDLNRQTTIEFPPMNIVENPAFRYRQSQAYGMRQDSVYRLFLRFDQPEDLFVDRLWVHTFNRLLPASVYGAKHPEYYSFINGMRRPGRASQWCLTNDEVFEIVAARIDSIFRANPDRTMISVSQNDSNFTYCRCEECEKINIEEGSPAGNYIRFLNRLAERFPDKEFSTLAYLFTMKPPRHVRPRPNVNIMLCDIDCDREVPLTDNLSGREFIEALQGWDAITDNIFVWDYGINFDNMIAPFPNFPILKPNIQLFRKHGVTMHFSQIGGAYGGDFSELRSYVVSKLMWNPDQDTDALILRFMRGYYGAAAPFLYQYEKLLEGALLAGGQRLWIYDSPVSHKNGMLNEACRKRYNQLFDQAEQAVAGDSVLLRRVHLARLPLLYSDLEIARTISDKDLGEVVRKLNTFERYVTDFGIPTLNERSNSPVDYCRLYRQRYLPSDAKNLAHGASIRWITPPAEKYRKLGETTLTDGLFGGASFTDSWTGWEGCDGAFIVDLGAEKTITTIETDFLHQLGQWILLPRSVTYSISSDDQTYQPFGRVDFPEDQSVPVKFVPATVSRPSMQARYVRVEVEGVKICPSWHYGVGCPCWFFLDEITIR